MRQSWYLRRGKRLLDFLLTVLALVVLSPLVLLVSAAIKVTSRGPVFYLQERIGKDGVPFRLCKFRSMSVGAEHKGAGILVENDDPRITAVGRILRKISLDELPQLFNVLRGEMSLVGPRPGLRYQADLYDENQRRRLLVVPGVTGLAQINGRNAINWERRIELDLRYIRRISLSADLLILVKTLPSVLFGKDLIADADYWKEKARRLSMAKPDGKDRDEEADTAHNPEVPFASTPEDN
ncbi:MAG: sugar transferase [Acidobacteriota bacterium]